MDLLTLQMLHQQTPSNYPREGLLIQVQVTACRDCTIRKGQRPIHHGGIHVVSRFASTETQYRPSPLEIVALRHEYCLPYQTESTFSGEVLEQILQKVLPLFQQELEISATYAPSCHGTHSAESRPELVAQPEFPVHNLPTLSTACIEGMKEIS